MTMIDVNAQTRIPGISRLSPEQLFELAVYLARTQPTWQVRVIPGPQSEGPIVLDGRMLAHEGVELF